MKYAKKRDANEAAIVTALEAAGAVVTRIGDNGTPDLLVAFRRRWTLLEVKDGEGEGKGRTDYRGKDGGRGELTAAQVKWWDREHAGAPRAIVHTPAEALAAVGAAETPGPGRVLDAVFRALEACRTRALDSDDDYQVVRAEVARELVELGERGGVTCWVLQVDGAPHGVGAIVVDAHEAEVLLDLALNRWSDAHPDATEADVEAAVRLVPTFAL